MIRYTALTIVLVLSAFNMSIAQGTLVYESGGELHPEEAVYNVNYYDLDLKINPADSTIFGKVGIHFDVVHPSNVIALALDPVLEIESITRLEDDKETDLRFERSDSSKTVRVFFPETIQPGERGVVEIEYGGKPLVASNPPWDGGLVWDKTPNGDPWVGVAVQTIGAWTWWPNKDHPSDKADSVGINITMPDDLVVASNGQLRGTTGLEDGWKTWHWFVSTPINNYNVTFNAAPYETISDTYESSSGDEMEIIFWVLPEFIKEAEKLFPQFAEQLEFMEDIAGPYPFRADKYGVVHAPYLGMEHQTLIAYGAGFEDGALFGEPSKFDDLHQHELAHEWWGNLVTAWDWRDFWIHEGFGTYMQALYAEHVSGEEDYRAMMELFKNRISSTSATAPRESQTTVEITGGGRGGDVYYKGAAFLHTLRYYMGDEAFFKSLRRFAYPTEEMESVTDGSHVRFATTDDYLTLTESISGQELDWLFEVYLRSAELPRLAVTRQGGMVRMEWHTEGDIRFPMPVDLEIGGERVNVSPENGVISIEVAEDVPVTIDPDGKILMEISEY